MLDIWHLMLLIWIYPQSIRWMIQIHWRLCLQTLLGCWLSIDGANRSILQQCWMTFLSIYPSLCRIPRFDIRQKAIWSMRYVLMTSHHHLLLDKIWVQIGLINQIMLIIFVLLLLAHFYLILILRRRNVVMMRVGLRLYGVFIFIFVWGSCVFQILLTTSGGIWHICKLAVSISSVVVSTVATCIELLILMFDSSLHQMRIIYCFLTPIR